MTAESAQLQRCRLPNGLEVTCVDEAEAATLYREIFTARCWLDRGLTLPDGATVIDVGANIGMSTLFFHYERPGVRLLCFEPAPLPFTALTSNVADHRIMAECRPVALGGEPGRTFLTYYPEVTTMSGLFSEPEHDADITRQYLRNSGFTEEDARDLVPGAHRGVRLSCEVATLSEEVRRAGLEKIDLLKIDVEKSELSVLNGMDEPTWSLIDQIALEVHDMAGSLNAILDRLQNHGFRTQVRQDPLLAGTAIYDVAGIRDGIAQ